jgi:hypothetical protein
MVSNENVNIDQNTVWKTWLGKRLQKKMRFLKERGKSS